jgi:hypothetical protein
MVLFGQSAGSVSVDLYNFAYYEDPIVSGFIMESLTAQLPVWSKDYEHTNFTFVAENLGCGNLDPVAELECMRHNVTAGAIEDFVANRSLAGTTPALNFRQIADGKTAFLNYTERAQGGFISKIVSLSLRVEFLNLC